MTTRYLKSPDRAGSFVTAEVRDRVSTMLLAIEREGLDAVRRYSRELDGWDPPSFVLGADAVAASASRVQEELRAHIATAHDHVRDFARLQRETLLDLEREVRPGGGLGHRHVPVASVGAYVPGGRYPMLASAFMSIAVAKVAGVETVVASAPPRDADGIHPAMLYAMHVSGADRIVCLGGVQALVAMTFGLLDGIEPVDMVVGPGNAFVAEAKRQLFGKVGIDLLAGPTEVLVIADATADAELVAADLLAQAEHGPTSVAGLIAVGDDVGERVLAAIDRLLPRWPTRDVVETSWGRYGWVAVVETHDAAIELADSEAMEHVEVQVARDEQDRYLHGLRNFGSLFLGEEATVVFGDKAVGTNHTLPTLGAARYTGGLWVGKFLKTLTYQRLTADGARATAPTAAAISDAEGFAGHAISARLRMTPATA